MPTEASVEPEAVGDFQRRVLEWFEHSGRKELPWQQDPTPYRVWVSEIMLQQTQVSVVIPFYQRFMQSFPVLHQLAQASHDAVLSHWSGLGYYSRARNLHAAARQVVETHAGVMPASVEELEKLPGIGRSTAGAIISLAHDRYAPILDGNVKRVLARCFAIEGWPGQARVSRLLWSLSELLTPAASVRDFNQAMMDLGAGTCTRTKPRCDTCPLSDICVAKTSDTISNYPGKKPARKVPCKQTCMLVLQDGQGRVLLEKRASSGIWGGLWGFPEHPDAETACDWFRRHFGNQPQSTRLPARQHAFSHFSLEITPLLVKTDNPESVVMDSDSHVWYKRSDIPTVGIAAPVARILEETE